MGIATWQVVFFAGMMVIPIFVVAMENTDKCIGRLRFFFWTFGIALIYVVAFNLLEVIHLALPDSLYFLIMFALLVLAVCLEVMRFRRIVWRARDAGWGKLVAYLSIIPVVSLICLIALLIKRPLSQKPTSSDASVYG